MHANATLHPAVNSLHYNNFFCLILTKTTIFATGFQRLTVQLFWVSSPSSCSQVCWYAIIICAVIQPHNHGSSRTNSTREFSWSHSRLLQSMCLPVIIIVIVHKKSLWLPTCSRACYAPRGESKERGEEKKTDCEVYEKIYTANKQIKSNLHQSHSSKLNRLNRPTVCLLSVWI